MSPEIPLPYWLRAMSALGPALAASATLLIGIIVAVIAYRQWRTAHEKVLLDLFDRRFKIHEMYRECLLDLFTQHGNLVGSKTRFKLQGAWSESRFLFGEEVPEFIKSSIQIIVQWEHAKRRATDGNEADRIKFGDIASDLDAQLSELSGQFSNLLMPYLKMDQKRG